MTTRSLAAGALLSMLIAAPAAGRSSVLAQGSPLAAARLDSLDATSRAAWREYVARSVQLDSVARQSMAAELRAVGRDRMTKAPFAAESFAIVPSMRGSWFAGDSARRTIANVISFQTPTGGWSKHVDLAAHRRAAGESWFSESDDWQWIGTIDQGGTTTQIRFLLAAMDGPDAPAALNAASRGIGYLLAAQMPSGCWPQVYPLMGGYHDAVAIADDANARVLALLRDVSSGSASRLPDSLRTRAAESYRRGVACVVRLQRPAIAGGAAWALFHDPLSGAPLPGRSYEPAALAPLETAGLLDVLLNDARADSATTVAAHAAASWLAREGLSGLRYESFALRTDPSAAPLWPRLVALDDGRPVFANRDGVRRHDWNELTDRRTGYVWFGTAPAAVLERYVAFAAAHPPVGPYARARSPLDSIAALPGRSRELDTSTLLARPRLARLSPAVRTAWTRYVERSREIGARDRASMDGELASVGRPGIARAAWAHDFEGMATRPGVWFATDTARRIGESILSFQLPSGGWSKHVDFRAGVRLPGVSYNGETAEWRFVPTIDNGSTTEELTFLSRIDSVRHDDRYVAAFARGIRYLLDAQMPDGCWPQVFPLQGGYHDAATFNDDAIVHVASLLRDVGAGRVAITDSVTRRMAASAARRALDCMLATQVVVRGRRTIWGQQHDPLTHEPVAARSYELASLGPDESVAVATFLMSEPHPSPRVTAAVDAAAAWYRANAVQGISYAHYALTRGASDGPLWGRMVDLGTGRPIFANRDGVKLYDYERLTDRRTGYRWFTAAPRGFLRDYDRWRATVRTAAAHSAPAPH